MKKIFRRKNLVFLFPLFALIVTIGAVYSSKNKTKIITPVSENTSLTYRRVYTISEDNDYVVPLTISYNPYESIDEEILHVLSTLKEGSSLTEKDKYTYTLSDDVKINSIDLDNRIVSIDFSEDFASYPVAKERKILESLVWTLSCFDEIDGVILSVDGLVLEKMPVGNTPLPDVLTKDIGINYFLGDNFSLYDTVNVVTYYQDEDGLLIPVTRRLNSDMSVSSLLNNMYEELSVDRELKIPSSLSYLCIEHILENDGVVSIEVSEEALFDETSIREELYELVMLTLNELNSLNKEISFTINGESMQVSGYEKVATVNSIYYNDLKI